LARSISKPVAELAHATEEISRGHLDYQVKIRSGDEFIALGLSFNKMAKKLQKALGEKDLINEDLKKSEEKYRTLFERVQHGIFISTREGKFIDCNQAMLDMLGYENKEEFLRLDITQDLYLNPKDREIFQSLIERDAFVKDFEVDFKRKDGEKITILLTAHTRRDEKGKIIGYEGLNSDITERRRLEENLRDLNARYLELLGFASHELKQPTAVLKGYLIMLRDETIGLLNTEKQRQAVNAMLRSVDKFTDMNNKYLRLSKIESGELEIVKKRFNLFQEVINPMRRRERIRLDKAKMRFNIENQEDFEKLEIMADSLLIEVVYANLVTNAIKYGKEGGEISLGFKENEKSLIFNVKNEGDGIPQDKLEVIFKKFVRLVDEKSPLKGSGLGLYNTKKITEIHDGRIWAESEEGKWVNFIFALPKD